MSKRDRYQDESEEELMLEPPRKNFLYDPYYRPSMQAPYRSEESYDQESDDEWDDEELLNPQRRPVPDSGYNSARESVRSAILIRPTTTRPQVICRPIFSDRRNGSFRPVPVPLRNFSHRFVPPREADLIQHGRRQPDHNRATQSCSVTVTRDQFSPDNSSTRGESAQGHGQEELTNPGLLGAGSGCSREQIQRFESCTQTHNLASSSTPTCEELVDTILSHLRDSLKDVMCSFGFGAPAAAETNDVPPVSNEDSIDLTSLDENSSEQASIDQSFVQESMDDNDEDLHSTLSNDTLAIDNSDLPSPSQKGMQPTINLIPTPKTLTRNPFINMAQRMMTPGVKVTDTLKSAGSKWRNMSTAEKKFYVDEARAVSKRKYTKNKDLNQLLKIFQNSTEDWVRSAKIVSLKLNRLMTRVFDDN